jgi:RNA polymerase sigma factor (sigma-70 family)
MDFSDHQLHERFLREADQRAFAKLVARHLPLVHSVALRVTGNPSAAEDVSQLVFCRLAATRSVIREEVSMAAWLHRASRLAALDFIRSEKRRRKREQIAAEHQAMNSNSTWEEISPVLDEVIDRLSPPDRALILARYFQGQSHTSIGRTLGLSEDATRMRVKRALEKLRALLTKRGVTTTASALALSLPAHAISPVAASLSAAISTTALASHTAYTALPLISLFTMTTKTVLVSGAILALAVTGIWKATSHVSSTTRENPAVLAGNERTHSSGASLREVSPAENAASKADDMRVHFNKKGDAMEKEFRDRFKERLDQFEIAVNLSKEQKRRILAAAEGDFVAARDLFSQSEDMRVGGEEVDGEEGAEEAEVDLTRVDALDRAVVGILTDEQQARYPEFKARERMARITGLAQRNMDQVFNGINPTRHQREAILKVFTEEATVRYDNYPYSDFTHLYWQYQDKDLQGIDYAFANDPNLRLEGAAHIKALRERIQLALDRRSELMRPYLDENQLRQYRENLEARVLEKYPDLTGN